MAPDLVTIRRQGDGREPDSVDGCRRLGAEDSWVVEGPMEILAGIQNALPPWTCKRVGGALLVQFVNTVGRMEVPHLGRIDVASGKWSERDFERMLADITRAVASLPFAAGTGAQVPHDRSLAFADPVLYHAFVYLRHVLSSAAPQEVQLAPALARIVADPHRRLRSVRQTVPLEATRRVDRTTLMDLACGRGAFRRATKSSFGTGALAGTMGGRLPLTVNEVRLLSSVDLPENQFVRAFLDMCLGIIDAVEQATTTGSMTAWFRQGLRAQCETMKRSLAPFRRHRIWDEVGVMDRVPLESTVLQRRTGYRDVLRHYVKLRLAPRIPFSHNALDRLLELKNIAELYELWCFFRVVDMTTFLIGPPTPVGLPERTSRSLFEQSLEWDLDVTWPTGVRVFYNLRFSKSRAGRHSYSVPLRPDVAVEVPDGPNRGLHLLDAKFRIDRFPSAEIRPESEGHDDEAEERSGTFKKGDLYKMHTYRDAIPAARSAWVLYPGTEWSFFEDAASVAMGEGGTVEGVGAVPLIPGGESARLVDLLGRILGSGRSGRSGP